MLSEPGLSSGGCEPLGFEDLPINKPGSIILPFSSSWNIVPTPALSTVADPSMDSVPTL